MKSTIRERFNLWMKQHVEASRWHAFEAAWHMGRAAMHKDLREELARVSKVAGGTEKLKDEHFQNAVDKAAGDSPAVAAAAP